VQINPHQHRHINTAHPTDIRVSILGTSGFDVTQIIPSTVTLGGAHPVFAFTRNINRDQFLDETFVFRGNDVQLPKGIIEATVTGSLKNGQTFATSTQVFNRNLSDYPAGKVANEQAKQAAAPNRLEFPVAFLAHRLATIPGTTAIPVPATAATASTNAAALQGPVIAIKRREPVVLAAGQRQAPQIPAHVQASMNRYLRHAGASPPAGTASPDKTTSAGTSAV
jgi:hypothetical protein